jgi:hypothetical protein
MANFQYLTPGDPLQISASDYNAIADATRQQLQSSFSMSSTTGTADFTQEGGETVWVANTTEEDRDFGEVLGIKEPFKIPETVSEWQAFKTYGTVYKGVDAKWDQTDQKWSSYGYGNFCVTAEPIAKGAVGRGIISGIAVCKLNIATDSYIYKSWHFRADIDPESPKQLKTYPGGCCQVLWTDGGGTGTDHTAVVLLGVDPIVRYYGKLLQNGGTVYMSTPGQMWIYKFENSWWYPAKIDGLDIHVPVYAPHHQRVAVTEGSWVCAVWNPDAFRLEVEAYECKFD